MADRFIDSLGEHPTLFTARDEGIVFAPGKVLSGQFEIVRFIGCGGMGVVYEAHDRLMDERVGLKTLLPSLLQNPRAAQRFIREIKTARKLRHEHIVRVYDVREDGPLLFYTMELLEGRTLRTHMQERGQFELPAAVRLLSQLCDALAYAHQFMVHRDISPENVMVLPDGRVKLLDFGLARDLRESTMTATGAQLGKGQYMAPEQRLDAAHVDARADIYSLGVLLFELLTGHLPLGYRRATEIVPELPPECDELLGRALCPVEGRLPSAAAFREALAKCVHVDGENSTPPPQDAVPIPEEVTTAGPVSEEPASAPGSARLRRLTLAILLMAAPLIFVLIYQIYAGNMWPWHAKATTPLPYPGMQLEEARAWQRETAPDAQVARTVDLGGGVKLELLWIPPGSFMMGSPEQEEGRSSDEGPQHRVEITRGFWIGQHEVTQAQWESVMGSNPSSFKGVGRPVESVSWEDCQTFLQQLNDRVTGRVFRLPTEAEWEYACRAGTTTPFHFGLRISTDLANYDGNHTYGNVRGSVYRQRTTQVGTFPSNAWGLHDMHGNVLEWCQDYYDEDYYQDGPGRDPENTTITLPRVLRGGSWFDEPGSCRSASRDGNHPEVASQGWGFRVVLSSPV